MSTGRSDGQIRHFSAQARACPISCESDPRLRDFSAAIAPRDSRKISSEDVGKLDLPDDAKGLNIARLTTVTAANANACAVLPS